MEKIELDKNKVKDQDIYDFEYKKLKELVEYRGKAYDLREVLLNGNGWYRMMAEHRIELPEPSFIEVDKEGNVVKESS